MPDNKQLTPDDAYDVLVAQVHAPVFFEKLARVYNIQPKSEEDTKELLLMAGQLRNAQEQQAMKQASNAGNFFSEARRDLTGTLVKQGYASLVDNDQTFKQAAAQAVQNPLIKEAAIVFNQYLATQLANANG